MRYICGRPGKKSKCIEFGLPWESKKANDLHPNKKNLQLKYTFFLFNPKINPSQQKLNSPPNVSLFTPRIISTSELVRWTLHCSLNLCLAKCQEQLQ